jgi:hypothetical protein
MPHRIADDPARTVLAELAAADAELAAEALETWADAGRDAARRLEAAGDEDGASHTWSQVDSLDRAGLALRTALAQSRTT